VARLRGSSETSEDIRQEIYLRMLRSTDFALVREPRAYLFKVARHVLYDLRGRERVRTSFFGSTDSADYFDTSEDPSGQVEASRELERILSMLPPLYRAVIVLRKGNGLHYHEIARELGISIHTVKKYMHLALSQIRTIMIWPK
jgi:RNA polymerase sigma factor (sigma-70 family)